MSFRPDPDADGKIRCDACRPNGMRRSMESFGTGKPKMIVCRHCNGTKRRPMPPGYVPSSQVPEPEPEPMDYTEVLDHLSSYSARWLLEKLLEADLVTPEQLIEICEGE